MGALLKQSNIKELPVIPKRTTERSKPKIGKYMLYSASSSRKLFIRIPSVLTKMFSSKCEEAMKNIRKTWFLKTSIRGELIANAGLFLENLVFTNFCYQCS